jgi:hypothetical protein
MLSSHSGLCWAVYAAAVGDFCIQMHGIMAAVLGLIYDISSYANL